VDGTRNVVEAIGGQWLMFASTGSTYGKVEGLCTEDTPIAPLTLYGSTKWEAERMVIDKGGVALRFATVFGLSPRLRLDLLVNDFVYQAVSNRQIILYEGHFRRTFLHARDAAEAYLFTLANHERMKGQAFNVGDESMNYTKRQIALKIREHVDFYLHEAEVGQDLDKRDYEVSYEKLKGLGFSAGIDLDRGIDELVRVLRHLHVTNEWRNV
jgi:nucleoside-diphosphate-sugar epimerase